MRIVLFASGMILQAIGMMLMLIMLIAQMRSSDPYVGMAAVFIGFPIVLLSAMITGLIVTYNGKLRANLRQRITSASKVMVAITFLAGCALFVFSARP